MGNVHDSLLEASRDGNASRVTTLLEKGANINHTHKESGETALTLSSQIGYDTVVELLLKKGANTNQKNSYGGTALYVACFNGHTKVVDRLLQHGADPNLKIQDGSTALMAAAFNGHNLIVIKLLVEHKAAVNIQRNDGGSALMSAVFNGNASTAKLLLENGADANLCKKDGVSPLICACNDGQYEIVSLLLQHRTDVNLASSKGQTALMEASSGGCLNIVKSLLQYKAEVNTENKDSQNALLMAILNRHPHTTIALLDAGAKLPINRRNIGKSKASNVVEDNCKNDATYSDMKTTGEASEEQRRDTKRTCVEDCSEEIEVVELERSSEGKVKVLKVERSMRVKNSRKTEAVVNGEAKESAEKDTEKQLRGTPAAVKTGVVNGVINEEEVIERKETNSQFGTETRLETSNISSTETEQSGGQDVVTGKDEVHEEKDSYISEDEDEAHRGPEEAARTREEVVAS